MNEWLAENRLKAEATPVVCAVGTVIYLAPGWCWGMATGYPLAFGLTVTGGALAWVVRWEVQERRIQRWLVHHMIRWFVPEDSESGEGWWEYALKTQKRSKPSATQLHDQWLAHVASDQETAGRAA